MPYTRNISGLHAGPSLFTFSGDEQLDVAAYQAAMTNTYLRKVPLADALIKQFKISFEAEDKERVRRLMVSMGWLDHLLDEAPDRGAAMVVYQNLLRSLSTKEQPPAIPAWVRPELRNIMILVRNATQSLPTKYIENVVAKALRIGAISLEKSANSNAKEYAVILTEEGSLSSDLVLECLSMTAHNSESYPQLHEWNRQAMVAATLLDTAIDLKQDYGNSLTHVRPTAGNRVYLFWQAINFIPIVIRELGIRGIRTVAKTGIN